MRALVVEDEPTSALLSRHVLEREGFVVDQALTGSAAIAMVLATDYDAIILDLGLPDLDGLEVMQAIRREGRTTPVLVLTGALDSDTSVRALDAGADDYIRKPPVPEELSARVRAIVRRGAKGRSDQLTCGNVALNRLSRQLFVNGTEVALTSKELPLLEHLLLHRDKVISRTELLERVWDMHFDPGSNVVDVNVARIRRKLQSAGADVLISARRGVGFVLAHEGAPSGAQPA
ncbi:MAG: DNA-binding response regulator [Gemmatimonadetes bacterium]|jgi:two-component system OmpR family response regulator|nr:DNA-binding response regulator [Gemmatimonadota bacterium]